MTTILIVDDNATIQRVLKHTLKREGYEIFSAWNGLEACDFLSAEVVDLAIVDIDMPEMNGIDLLHHIRGDERLGNLPVIMLTASGLDEDRINAAAAGADVFLTKPTSSRELTETVAELLK